jgi:hypothetical protein
MTPATATRARAGALDPEHDQLFLRRDITRARSLDR